MDTYWPPGQSWPIGLEESNNTFVHSNKVSCGPISSLQKKQQQEKTISYPKHSKRFSRKQSVFLFKTLHIKPRRQLCLTQAVILSSTSNFTSEPQVKNVL